VLNYHRTPLPPGDILTAHCPVTQKGIVGASQAYFFFRSVERQARRASSKGTDGVGLAAVWNSVPMTGIFDKYADNCTVQAANWILSHCSHEWFIWQTFVQGHICQIIARSLWSPSHYQCTCTLDVRMILSVYTEVARLLIKHKHRPPIEIGNTYDSASIQNSSGKCGSFSHSRVRMSKWRRLRLSSSGMWRRVASGSAINISERCEIWSTNNDGAECWSLLTCYAA